MSQNSKMLREKELLQAQHRYEKKQARDRVKERKAGTRRLIERGAILEKVYPAAKEMDNETLENTLVLLFKNL